MDCREIFDIKEVYKYGKNWKCKPCHASWRWCRDNDPGWGSYNAEQKRLTVVANRKASARGSARKLIAQHKASGAGHDLDRRVLLVKLFSDKCQILLNILFNNHVLKFEFSIKQNNT